MEAREIIVLMKYDIACIVGVEERFPLNNFPSAAIFYSYIKREYIVKLIIGKNKDNIINNLSEVDLLDNMVVLDVRRESRYRYRMGDDM
jgi:hypothetical protein